MGVTRCSGCSKGLGMFDNYPNGSTMHKCKKCGMLGCRNRKCSMCIIDTSKGGDHTCKFCGYMGGANFAVELR